MSITTKQWQLFRLGEVCTTNNQTLKKGSKHETILYLDTGSITQNVISELQEYTIKEAPSRAKRLVQEGDVVYSSVRPIQNHYGLIQQPAENLVVSTGFIVATPIKEKLDSNYLYYLVSQKQFNQKMQQIAEHSTSTYPSIKPEHFESFEVRLPLLPEQKAIARVLGCLDDKIELLRSQNETLEELGAQLFKQWFVDFNFPDTQGRPYQASGGQMTQTPKGKIPQGWQYKTLGGLIDLSIGRTPPRKQSQWFSSKGGQKWISIKDMGGSEVFINKTSEYLVDEAIKKFRIPEIPKDTVILSFKMTVGRIAITNQLMYSNEAIAHLKLITDEIDRYYLFLYLNQFNFDKIGSTSSITKAFNSQSIRDIEIPVPKKTVLDKFSVLQNGIFDKIRQNEQQIQTLAKLRDTLLPQLMSGQLRVKF